MALLGALAQLGLVGSKGFLLEHGWKHSTVLRLCVFLRLATSLNVSHSWIQVSWKQLNNRWKDLKAKVVVLKMGAQFFQLIAYHPEIPIRLVPQYICRLIPLYILYIYIIYYIYTHFHYTTKNVTLFKFQRRSSTKIMASPWISPIQRSCVWGAKAGYIVVLQLAVTSNSMDLFVKRTK